MWKKKRKEDEKRKKQTKNVNKRFNWKCQKERMKGRKKKE